MESLEQTSTHTKRKLGTTDDSSHEHFYAFDIEHDQTTKSFCCRSPSLPTSIGNYQQTTKIIQEFNIQQSNSTDITVSSTINIKSTSKQSTNEFLSEADFQRVVQDITPADRDLFDEFLNGIKQKTDDYLFLSSFDDLPMTNHEHDSISHRHSSLSLPNAHSSLNLNDRRRNSIPRGSSTIHYSPNSIPISTRPTNTAAAQTLKQMAVQHQQRAMYNQQYSSIPYNHRPYYQQTENDSTFYYQQTNSYPSIQQQSNVNELQNYPYQASSSSSSSSYYTQPQQHSQIPVSSTSSSYLMNNYSPSNGLSPTLPTSSFYSQEDHLPLLDL